MANWERKLELAIVGDADSELAPANIRLTSAISTANLANAACCQDALNHVVDLLRRENVPFRPLVDVCEDHAHVLLFTASATFWQEKRGNEHAQCVVRATLAGCCTAAKVDQVYPKNLRQRALTEWKRASPDAGSIIHGSGLGVLDHYVPAIEILSAAMFRVRLPQCFGVVVTDSEELMSAWQRLDPASQKLVKDMAARMATG